ncbi:MAG TPA: S9 family peptidase [Isosphaeraceae bacterium]|nr:S9 family peptidase [Isosphaeraceae bacterium]
MRPFRPRVLVLCASLLVAGVRVVAQDRITPRPGNEGPARVHNYRETAISPDGRRVAWVEVFDGTGGPSSGSSRIVVADLAEGGGRPRRITAGAGPAGRAEHSIAWSPDGGRLAFLSDHDQPGQLQVYVAAADGGEARRLTTVSGFLADPRWSPDGTRLGVLFTQGAARANGPLQPGAIRTGVIDDEAVLEQRLSTIELSSGALRQVSPPDLYVYEYDWSPDSTQCVAIAAHGSGDDHWYIAQLYVLAVATGEARSILDPKMQVAMPRWSPDGRTIAFLGGLMSDEGVNGGDIYVLPATGGPARNLTPALEGSASWLQWHLSSDSILFAEHRDGGSGLARVDRNGGVTRLWAGAERITAAASLAALGVSASRDQAALALIRQSFREPPEIWAGAPGRWRAVTHANAGARPDWGEAASVHWRSDDLEIQGWLLAPRDREPGRRSPLIVFVHGGPSSAWTPRWLGEDSAQAALSRRGYYVLLPNPRGSFGWGERFTKANVKDLGYGDLRDILRGVDEVVRTHPVDPKRLGITGWSYGGYMTMWAVTQTGRFGAAVAGAGICNWQSYYGQNGIDQWMIPFFGASPYDDPAVYARSAPITFIKHVKTPTLILVGERDVECPVPQSQEFHHALKTLGVATQMVVYPGEGHRIARPEHRRDLVERTVGWFDRYLAPEPGRASPAGR